MEMGLSSESSPTDVSGWMLLEVGSTRVALPKSDLQRVELAADLTDAPSDQGATAGGFITEDGVCWPVYGLDERLQPDSSMREACRICVFVRSQETVWGLLCDRVNLIEELAVQPTPACLGRLARLARGLALEEDGVVLITDAADLADHLMPLSGHVEHEQSD